VRTDRSFWTTLPGILTAVAGLITAIGGILAIVVKVDDASSSERSAEIRTALSAPGSPSTTSEPRPGSRVPTSPPITSALRLRGGVPISSPTATAPPTTTAAPPITSAPRPESAVPISPPTTSTPPPSSPTTTSTPTPREGFRVVEVFLRADPFDYTGTCPVTIKFSGRISVAGGSGTVAYRFLRSDGASAPVQTLHFDEAGSQDIETSWRRSEGSGWMQLEVLDPQPTRRSEKATFAINCT
jgi:hypothetical protein